MPCPKQSVYAATKHGLHGFFDSFRLELEHKNVPVTVTTVVLGLIETNTAVDLTADDIKLPMGQADAAAMAILRGAHRGLEEVYHPTSQSLHLAAVLRSLPGLRFLLDRITLAMSGGRNVLWELN
jgi:short-subunit dehydrogenase